MIIVFDASVQKISDCSLTIEYSTIILIRLSIYPATFLITSRDLHTFPPFLWASKSEVITKYNVHKFFYLKFKACIYYHHPSFYNFITRKYKFIVTFSMSEVHSISTVQQSVTHLIILFLINELLYLFKRFI